MDVDGHEGGATPKDPVASIGGQLPHLSTGNRAALRRIFLTRSADADGVVMGLLSAAEVPEAEWRGPASLKRWRLIAHVAATLSGTAGVNPHSPMRPLGQALQAAGFSENRLMRLTTARGPALIDQIVHAARYLAQAGQVQIDLRTVRALVSDRADIAEDARLRIARDYYSAAYKAKEKP
ncbi:CRISPR type I-E-associated protein CasB/Cse2 [Sphingobium fontiphilum]|uniref:CRISPR type I-E-associated protein CasB/Cse2 n=1 Tax=Sphingobium fontiphilum TaxID=944425 RepID=A0A7W6DFY3_9SPHN|nr:type I-E CRISPR-associated protein Cse2/CasB [Sphingobium fontiphilum]MBB3982551.1 CRISPR type I-E-associated protein CasB/Cse2 [Sphingobium fontiphilum]